MSLHKTKKQLIRLLSKVDDRVIALSGKWGTGKTHLWNEVKAESEDDNVKNALYVSLFGLSNIDQMKRKLIENSLPGIESHGGIFDGLRNIFSASVKAASEYYKALAAINDINVLLMAPVVLRNKLIVIDDIERKHEKLGIDEVLGFIDEYNQQHGSRFVLLLNDDQLSTNEVQKKLWETFREKVIDQEIKISTSAEEAFYIAIGLRSSMYAEAIKKASITCSLTNIRVIVKIIKVANQILAGRDLELAIQSRVIPSIVLFSAIHYHGMSDGPDFKFALEVGNPDWQRFAKNEDEEISPEEKREEGWRILMQDLGILNCDEFEKRLVEFLESGLYEAASIEAIIDRYVSESEAMNARETARDFIKKVIWDHRVSEEELVAEAVDLPSIAGLLDPFVATELQSLLKELPGGEAIGDEVIDNWIEAFREKNLSTVNDENPFGNPIHPDIQAEFDALKATAQANTTVVDACMHVFESGGWGTMQEVALRQASVRDFETAIREMTDLDRLRRFFRYMIQMRQQHASYDQHFGTASDHFVAACRSIVNDTTSPRLASLIQRLFDHASLSSDLAPEAGRSEET